VTGVSPRNAQVKNALKPTSTMARFVIVLSFAKQRAICGTDRNFAVEPGAHAAHFVLLSTSLAHVASTIGPKLFTSHTGRVPM
jgi:hypothetical protein